MTTRLTQALATKAMENHPPATQLYDDEVSGLRLIVGKKSASYKLVGRINDGTDRYVSVTIGRTDEVSLKTARERATELRLALRRGEDPRTPKSSVPTLGDAADRYFEARSDELRPSTRRWYRAKVDGALASLKKLPVDRIDREQVRALHESITKKHGKGCANGAMRVLKLLINDVGRTHDLPPNPVSRGVRLHREFPRDWAIGPDDMPSMWKQLDGMEDRIRRACWLTMMMTGLRSHDARSIHWENLDDDGVLFVPAPKGGEHRAFSIPLPRAVLQTLEEVRSLTAPLENGFVFASSGSRSGHVEDLRRTKAFPFAPHQMRHTYRTHALEAGVDFQTVTMLMNHATTHVSFNYVTKAHLVGHMREAQEAISGRLLSFRSN